MPSRILYLTSLAISFASAKCSPTSYGANNTSPSTGYPPCDALIQAGLEDRVLGRTSSNYETGLEGWWAYNTRLHPWCLVQPQTAEEVSLALTTLVNVNDGAGDWSIAIKSGGHSLGVSNNIENGVTIDLAKLNDVTYDAETNLASAGPGGKWMDLYKKLGEKHNVSAVGGRDGDVGVGGFLLGGGISYYSPTKGVGANNIASAQVVLANGTIVTASKDENSDLLHALKGGGMNVGIVTRFDLEAFPAQNLSYGQRVISIDHSKDLTKSLANFVDAQGTDDVLVPTWMRDSNISNKTVSLAIRVNLVGDLETKAFDEINDIPALDDPGMASISLADAAAGSQVPGGMRTTWQTLTLANDVDILNHCVDLHENFVSKLGEFLAPDAFMSMMIPQPLPQLFIEASTKRGGDITGVEESVDGNAIVWVGGVLLNPKKTTEADFAKAQGLVSEWTAGIEKYASSVGGLKEYIDLNYAAASQDPLSTYGKKNIKFLKRVAEKYDPDGVFQRRVPGGFKISRVS